MSQQTASMKVGDSKQITAAADPVGADDEDAVNGAITYASDNTDVATVAADGTITAVAEGTANITAKSGSFNSAVKVTVAAAA